MRRPTWGHRACHPPPPPPPAETSGGQNVQHGGSRPPQAVHRRPGDAVTAASAAIAPARGASLPGGGVRGSVPVRHRSARQTGGEGSAQLRIPSPSGKWRIPASHRMRINTEANAKFHRSRLGDKSKSRAENFWTECVLCSNVYKAALEYFVPTGRLD